MAAVGMYDGFEKFQAPGEPEIIEALRRAVVVLDTNVLLSLYKFNDDTRSDYLGALSKLGNRLWVPHQVMLEFWRSRRAVLVTIRQNYSGILNSLTSTHRQAADNVRRFARASAMPAEEHAELDASIEAMFTQISERIGQHLKALVDPAQPTSADEILAQLAPVLESHVEPAPDPQDRSQWLQEGARRVVAQIPPGYLDAAKEDTGSPDGAAGDYLVWRAAMAEATKRGLDLLIITGDVKEDWWVRYEGTAIGPHPDLAEEFRQVSGGKTLYLLQPQEFLRLSREGLGAQVSDSSIDNVEDLIRTPADPDPEPVLGDAPWTPEGVHEMLRRLDGEGAFQATVIRRAARWGWLDRKAILRLAGRDPVAGSLQGVTRPVMRLQEALVGEGLLARGTEPMLTVHYDGGQLTRLSIPASVRDILSAEAHPDTPTLDPELAAALVTEPEVGDAVTGPTSPEPGEKAP